MKLPLSNPELIPIFGHFIKCPNMGINQTGLVGGMTFLYCRTMTLSCCFDKILKDIDKLI